MMLDRAKHGGLVVRSAAARRVEGSFQLVSRDRLPGVSLEISKYREERLGAFFRSPYFSHRGFPARKPALALAPMRAEGVLNSGEGLAPSAEACGEELSHVPFV
jgi:hypothetical protein